MRSLALTLAAAAGLAALTGCASSTTNAAQPATHKSATPAASASEPAATVAPVADGTSNPAANQQAAALMHAEDAKLAALYAQGRSTINTPAGVKWYTSIQGGTTIATAMLNVDRQVNALYGPNDAEPSQVQDWGNSEIAGDLGQWYLGDLNGQSGDPSLAAKVSTDLASMEAAANAVGSSH